MRRAVFLDRDGVINRAQVRNGKPYPPSNLNELEILPGVADALIRLQAAGFRRIVVTNQPDVARGQQTREFVESIHAALLTSGLAIDSFRVCYHDDADDCACRKPKPGMLLTAAREEKLELAASFMVGDRWRDIEAGRRAGCTTIFIDHHYTEPRPDSPDLCVNSLAEAVDWIIARVEEEKRGLDEEHR